MRALRPLALLLALLAPASFAESLYQVELILFRQAGEPVPASQPAPDDWASGAERLSPASERSTTLNSEAAKLTPGNGYQVLLHQAWQQSLGEQASAVALSHGQEQFGQYPIQGTLSLKQGRFTDVEANLWVNEFDENGVLTGSEHLKQATRLKPGELTYLDHGSLGLLIRVNRL